jgi:antitoxin (DNA-binding transcriptional repressor) of toxin-antitoxin stability system
MMVNMLEAKTNLSKLVESVESGVETEVILARHGQPVARLVRLQNNNVAGLIGVAKGRIPFNDAAFDALDGEIASLFNNPPALLKGQQ